MLLLVTASLLSVTGVMAYQVLVTLSCTAVTEVLGEFLPFLLFQTIILAMYLIYMMYIACFNIG